MKLKYNLALGVAQAAIASASTGNLYADSDLYWKQLGGFTYSTKQVHAYKADGIFLTQSSLKPVAETMATRPLSLAVRFRELADQWRQETSFQSSLTAKFNHPAYQSVIDMGFNALPLVLAELQTGSKHWAYALKKIVGFDVGSAADNPRDAAASWLEWGRSTKLIK